MTQPIHYARDYVSYYKTDLLDSIFEEQYKRDIRLLELNGVDFIIEELDGYTFICVEGCSSKEIAEEILNG